MNNSAKLLADFDVLFQSSKYSVLNFKEWLDSLSQAELEDVTPELVAHVFYYHRGMAKAAIELLREAAESRTSQPALSEIRAMLELAIKAIRQLEQALPEVFEVEVKLQKRRASAKGKRGAEARHNKKGGSREKVEKIRAIWASGKYTSRTVCAAQECDHLEMSFDAARKALRNTPNPA